MSTTDFRFNGITRGILIFLFLFLTFSSLHAEEIFTGVTYTTGKASNGTAYYLIKIDTYRAGLQSYVTKASEYKQRTSSYATSHDLAVAINGGFYNTANHAPVGVVVSEKNFWGYLTAEQAPIGLDKDGFVQFSGLGNNAYQTWAWNALSGMPLLVENGIAKNYGTGDLPSGLAAIAGNNPRTAIGTDVKKRYLMFFVCDGRNKNNSAGLSFNAMGTLLASLGFHWAVNLDGGGSSTMYIKNKGLVNSPSDGSERVVSNHIGYKALPLAPPNPICSTPTTVSNHSDVFYDVAKTDAGLEAMTALKNSGITNGCSTGSTPYFCPDCKLKRRDAVILLIRAKGLSEYKPATPTFSDVPKTDYGYGYIEAAVKAGLISGMPGGQFDPDRAATRVEIATMITSFVPLSTSSTCSSSFGDVDNSDWYCKAVMALKNANITTGCNTNRTRFCPLEQVTRREMAIFMMRAFNLNVSECSPSDKKCDNGRLYSCLSNGTWDSGTACDTNVCANAYECKPECQSSDKKCDNGRLYACLSNGTWNSGTACDTNVCANAYACQMIDKACMYHADASKNDSRCESGLIKHCQSDGQWGASSPCPDSMGCASLYACETFIKECTYDANPGLNEKKCENGRLYVCIGSGKWGQGEACPDQMICEDRYSCRVPIDKECNYNPIESLNDLRCQDGQIQLCNFDGTWAEGIHCPDDMPCASPKTCQKKTAEKTCTYDEQNTKNESKCDNGRLYQCTPIGQWSTGVACPNNAACADDISCERIPTQDEKECDFSSDATDGQSKCVDGQLFRCTQANAWDAGEACPNAAPCLNAYICAIADEVKPDPNDTPNDGDHDSGGKPGHIISADSACSTQLHARAETQKLGLLILSALGIFALMRRRKEEEIATAPKR